VSDDQSGITDEVAVEHTEGAPEDAAQEAPVVDGAVSDQEKLADAEAEQNGDTEEKAPVVAAVSPWAEEPVVDNADDRSAAIINKSQVDPTYVPIPEGEEGALTGVAPAGVPENAYVEEALAEEAGEVQREVRNTEHGWTAQSSHGVLLPHQVPSQDYAQIEANPDERLLATRPDLLGSAAALEKNDDFTEQDTF
jgi:hypothetical protein